MVELPNQLHYIHRPRNYKHSIVIYEFRLMDLSMLANYLISQEGMHQPINVINSCIKSDRLGRTYDSRAMRTNV